MPLDKSFERLFSDCPQHDRSRADSKKFKLVLSRFHFATEVDAADAAMEMDERYPSCDKRRRVGY